MKTMSRLLLTTWLLTLVPLSVLAITAEEKGLSIAREADRRDMGFGDIAANLTMILRNHAGHETVRILRRTTLEMLDDGDKNLIVFDSPLDIKGTAVLTYTHALDPDDQWVFLPALKRTKRISTVNKSGPFVGSEFAFEDLAAVMVEKYQYKYLRQEMLDGRDCFVMELVPAYKHSGYTRLLQWLDSTMYQPLKVVFYDRKNALLKTLRFENYQQYLGKYWRPGEMTMENHQTGKSTTLLWKEYRFRTGLSDRDFAKSVLR